MLFPRALGVEARKGFSSKRRWVSGPGWGCTGAETNLLSLISLPSPCPKRSEREAKESFPEGEYVWNLLFFLSEVVKPLMVKTTLSPSPPPCRPLLQHTLPVAEAGSLLPSLEWTWVNGRESPIFLFCPVALFLVSVGFSLLVRRATLVLQIMWDRKENNKDKGRNLHMVCVRDFSGRS